MDYCKIRGNRICYPLKAQCAPYEQVYIEITKKCNLNCPYCFNNSGNSVSSEIELNEILDIVRITAKPGIEYIISGGEPLIRNDLYKLCKSISEYGYPVAILTNGTLLNDVIIDQLGGMVRWQISLGALLCEKMNNTYKGALNTVINNIKYLVQQGFREKITVAITIVKENIKQLDNIIDMLSELGVANILLTFVGKRGRAIREWGKMEVSNTQKLAVIAHITRKYMPYIKHTRVNFCGLELDQHIKKYSQGLVINNCSKASELFIDADGKVSICPLFETLCNCLEFDRLTYKALGLEESINIELPHVDTCKKCIMNHNCASLCCRSRSELMNNDIQEVWDE